MPQTSSALASAAGRHEGPTSECCKLAALCTWGGRLDETHRNRTHAHISSTLHYDSLCIQVKRIFAAELCDGGWKHGCDLLVMPGGADVPYCEQLNGAGNRHIRGMTP